MPQFLQGYTLVWHAACKCVTILAVAFAAHVNYRFAHLRSMVLEHIASRTTSTFNNSKLLIWARPAVLRNIRATMCSIVSNRIIDEPYREWARILWIVICRERKCFNLLYNIVVCKSIISNESLACLKEAHTVSFSVLTKRCAEHASKKIDAKTKRHWHFGANQT